MYCVLLIDFGSTFTKITAVDLDNELIVGTAKAFTTIDTDVSEGLNSALYILSKQISSIEIFETYACSSAAGGLKMITVGLVPDLTVMAGKMAALSAGARVIGTYSYELSSYELKEINELKPDILLLTGGTDGGNKSVIIHNARAIALIPYDFPVVVAGNRCVAQEIATILNDSGKQANISENVMPEFNVLNIEPARETIRSIFLKRIIRAKGLTKLESVLNGILMPTPSSVLNAAFLLSQGFGDEPGLGDLMVIDVGGATTDVHTIGNGNPTKPGVVMKGLPEPFAKRTVEGDLGVRYNVMSLVDIAGLDNIVRESGLNRVEAEEQLIKIAGNPAILPEQDQKLACLDSSLAAMAVKYATERHAGIIETVYTPLGAMHLQTGKDLGSINTVVGTGGPIINSLNPKSILIQALKDNEKSSMILKPHAAKFYLDQQYIMAAMGLLGENYPEIAIRIMKKSFQVM